MAAPGNGSRRYELHASGAIAEAIRRVHSEASLQGRGEIVTRALRRLIWRIEIDPYQIGEPVYRLPGLRMQVRTAVVQPLVVDFAVCEDRPLVFIKGVKLLSAKDK